MFFIYLIAYVGLNTILGVMFGVCFPLRKDVSDACKSLRGFLFYCKQEFTREVYMLFVLSFVVAYIVTKARFFIRRIRDSIL
jgi:hypothetical protein